MSLQSPVGSRAQFPKPPRWTVVVLAALVIVGAGHFFVGVAQIITEVQVTDELLGCIREPGNPQALDAMRQAADDDSLDGGGTRSLFETVTVDDLVNEVFMCSLRFGDTVILPIGERILIPLAIIMTIWFGVTVMFGGGNPSEVIGFLFRMGFVVLLFQNYFFDTPQLTPLGEGQGVVWTVSRQGIILGRTLVEDARTFADDAYNDAREAVVRREVARIVGNVMDPDGEYTAEELSEIADAARRGVEQRAEEQVENMILGYIERTWRNFLWILKWFVYAQYLWAFVGLSVIGILGPLFIPWMIVPQLDWLFWSWFRALLQLTIHMMTTAVMYVVASLILAVPMHHIAAFRYDSDPETAGDIAVFVFSLVVPYTPIILMIAAAALKSGAFASGLMSGSGMTGGGLVGGTGLGGSIFSASTLATNPEARKVAMRSAKHNIGAASHLLGTGYAAGRAGNLAAIMPLSRRSGPRWSDAQDVYRDYAYRRGRLERIRGERVDRRDRQGSIVDDDGQRDVPASRRTAQDQFYYDEWGSLESDKAFEQKKSWNRAKDLTDSRRISEGRESLFGDTPSAQAQQTREQYKDWLDEEPAPSGGAPGGTSAPNAYSDWHEPPPPDGKSGDSK